LSVAKGMGHDSIYGLLQRAILRRHPQVCLCACASVRCAFVSAAIQTDRHAVLTGVRLVGCMQTGGCIWLERVAHSTRWVGDWEGVGWDAVGWGTHKCRCLQVARRFDAMAAWSWAAALRCTDTLP
jgi:hypothetical protein